MIGIGTPNSHNKIPRPMISSCVQFWLDYRPVRSGFQLSRTYPPSVAARLAQKAPISSEAVSHRDNLAAALRALSKAVFAWLMTSETRLSASCLTKSRADRYDLRQICAVRRRNITTTKAGHEDTRDLAASGFHIGRIWACGRIGSQQRIHVIIHRTAGCRCKHDATPAMLLAAAAKNAALSTVANAHAKKP